MHTRTIPPSAAQAIKKAIQEKNDIDIEIDALSKRLNEMAQKRSELSGKLNGIIVGVAVASGFDTSKNIQISEDFTTMSGDAIDTEASK